MSVPRTEWRELVDLFVFTAIKQQVSLKPRDLKDIMDRTGFAHPIPNSKLWDVHVAGVLVDDHDLSVQICAAKRKYRKYGL